MKRDTKILFIHHASGWGGAPINMINIIIALRFRGYVIEVLLLRNSDLVTYLKSQDISYKIVDHWFYKKFYRYFSHTVPGYTRWFNLPTLVHLSISWLLSRYIFAPQILRQVDHDIIHLNSSVLTDWLSPSAKKAKVVMHVQEPFSSGLFGLRSRFFRNQMVKYCNHIIVISEDNKTRLGISHNISIVYNFAEFATQIPNKESYESRRALYLGGASNIKGFHLLIDSAPLLDKEIEILFLGYYPQVRESARHFLKYLLSFTYRRMVRSLRLMRSNPNFLEIGVVENPIPYINNVACVICPFVIPHFARPIVEAFVNYKGVIATKVEGMDEIVTDNEDGLLINLDSESLAIALNSLLNDKRKLKQFGLSGYIKSQKLFSSLNIDKIELIYQNIIKPI
ncbi:MAG: glycosyltransferase family 4 protein [Ignavibacteria bacterium]|nr:glycosyltransferase family 4 protein [Ignavibacteria bacterium]